MAVCETCKEELPKREPGYINFHRCKGRPLTPEEKGEEQRIERLAALMVETTTEYDWEELPLYLQGILKHTARSLYHHMDNQSIIGEVVTEQKELQPWVQKEYDEIVRKAIE